MRSPVLVQLVQIQIRPGLRDAFLKAFHVNWQGSQHEPGNVRFDLLCDPEDDHSFTVYEIFRDEAALEAHRATAHYRQCVEAIGPMQTGQRLKRFYHAVMVDDAARPAT